MRWLFLGALVLGGCVGVVVDERGEEAVGGGAPALVAPPAAEVVTAAPTFDAGACPGADAATFDPGCLDVGGAPLPDGTPCACGACHVGRCY